jgi:2,5-diketo-D-gluconate reductase B
VEVIATRGMRMPKLGLGTWRSWGDECRRAVESALALGYRHIDTAAMYDNEDQVGAAIAASGVARGELFLTTKVWHDQFAPEAMRRSIETSLRKLGTDYLDLYLLHWPAPGMDMGAVLGSLTRLKEAGLARSVGVSNFTIALLREAVEVVQAPIACNQIEYHVLLDESKLVAYARSQGVATVAYRPVAKNLVAEFPEIAAIARKHAATPAQVALAWLLEQELVGAIPKSTHPAWQRENLDALGLRLDEADRAAIALLPKNRRLSSGAFRLAWDSPA